MCILWLTLGGFGAGCSLICGDGVQVRVLPVQLTDGSHLSDVKNVCVSIVHWCICQCVNFICAVSLFFRFSFNHMCSMCLCFAAWFAFNLFRFFFLCLIFILFLFLLFAFFSIFLISVY